MCGWLISYPQSTNPASGPGTPYLLVLQKSGWTWYNNAAARCAESNLKNKHNKQNKSNFN